MEELQPLAPINFFQLVIDCRHIPEEHRFPYFNRRNYKKYLLPVTTNLCHEVPIAEVAMGWSDEGIECYCIVKKALGDAFYPNVIRGDSLELFIDTRDVKTSGYNTRFCHHFFFFPYAVDGVQTGELTHFRTDDAHEWCAAGALSVKSELEGSGYILNGFIPKECLVGFDPQQFNRLGFSYRINRGGLSPQHLTALSEEFTLEQQPSLWSQMRLLP